MRTMRASVALLLALLTIFASAGVVLASHDWIQLYSRSKVGAQYRVYSYTDSDANNDRHSPWSADFGYADHWIARTPYGDDVAYKTASCTGENACERTQTANSYLPLGEYFWLRTMHCGKDVVGGTTHASPYNDTGPFMVCNQRSLHQWRIVTSWSY